MFSDGAVFLTLISLLVVGLVIATLPFWLLWNWIMPLFGLPNLTIFQCWGLILLIQILHFPYTYTKDK